MGAVVSGVGMAAGVGLGVTVGVATALGPGVTVGVRGAKICARSNEAADHARLSPPALVKLPAA